MVHILMFFSVQNKTRDMIVHVPYDDALFMMT